VKFPPLRALLSGWLRLAIVFVVVLLSVRSARGDLLFATTNATWKMFKGRSEASFPDSTLWRQPLFDDSAWTNAPAPIYYTSTSTEPPFYNGGPVPGTVISDMLNSFTSVYLRKTFAVTNASLDRAISIQAAVDDGFIAWLNGVELIRTNMPAGFVAYNGRALASAAEPVPLQTFVFSNGSSLLIEGTNVLAIQACNWDPASSDFGIMAGLSLDRIDTSIPRIITQPQDQIAALGSTVTFRVQASGDPPLAFRWYFNGNPLTTATNSALVISNVQNANVGSYFAIVSNSSGSASSLTVSLVIGSCATPPGDLVSWWPFNNSPVDVIGTANLLLNGAGYAPGRVSQGLLLNGAGNFAKAAASSGLNIGSEGGMTIEGWISPGDASRLMDVVEWNNGQSSIGLHIATSTFSTRDLYANLVDTAGVSHQIYSGTGALQDNVFQHIALTYNRLNGDAALYLNGAAVARTNLGVFTPQTSFDFYVGTRISGVAQGIFFFGIVDELSLYRRDLSAAEVLSIYNAGFAGKCGTALPLAIITQPQDAQILQGSNASFSVVAQGTSPLQYQWFFNDSPLFGANQSVFNVPSAQPQQEGFYKVVISDATGSTTSNPVRLKVILPLGFSSQPQNLMAPVGSSASFSALGQGTGALTYQWFHNSFPIPSAESPQFVLQNLAAADAGEYFAVLSDTSHSVTSSPALLTVLSDAVPQITEFMADNSGGILDEDGDASDWIEILNATAAPVNLQGWFLTDQAANLTKWQFPSTNLPPAAYMLVFASGKNRVVAGNPLHTNFRLDSGGCYLALVKPDGVTVTSEFAPVYPGQRSGVSYGTAGLYFLTPTPAQANGPGILGFVKDTKFSPGRGEYFAPTNVNLSCATPGATLIFTTNGDEPTPSHGIQVPPGNPDLPPETNLLLSATTVLRAAAFKQGYLPSDVDTHSYIFPASVSVQVRPQGASTTWIEDPPGDGQAYPADFAVDPSVVNSTAPGYSFTNALTSIPTLSVVTPIDGLFGSSTGIYTHTRMEGPAWERRASAELIFVDGRDGFHSGTGVKIHGAVSRLPHATPKHPLRLMFREEYGASKLRFPLFPQADVNTFDQLVLRACSTDSWPIANTVDFLWYNYDATYQRDQWMRDTQLALGHVSARGIYVQLYLNGLYWGLYNLTERLNDSFFADRLGGEKEEYDVVTDFDGIAVSGDRTPWTQLLQLAGRAPSDPNALLQMQGLNPDATRNTNFPVLINLDNFIDYMAVHIYAAAIDFPGRNWWAARRRGPASDGFHFFVWDQEIALDRLDRSTTWGASPQAIEAVNEANTPGQVYDGLRRDTEFQLRFADRLQKHLFNGGVLTLQSNVARWAARASEIDHAIVGESARWGDAHHAPAYNRQTDWLRMSNFTANVYFPSNHFKAWQRFRNVNLYPTTGAPAFNQFGGALGDNFLLTITHTNATGTVYYTLDGSDPRLRGGAVAAGALVYTQPIAFAGPTLVRARVRAGAAWSAIIEATFYPPQDFSRLQLSEIMYNPPRFGTNDGDELEFLELKNAGTVALDLGGLAFSRGITFTFSNKTVIPPGQYFVLARNPALFGAQHPGVIVNGIYTGKLDNSGETLELVTALGGRVLSVSYNNAVPWPPEADNSGFSLQRIDFSLSATNPAAWIAAVPTPGAAAPAFFVDADHNGLPDGWEELFGLSDPAGDADGDGVSNYQEFLAGTNPLDPNDRLKIELFSVTASNANTSVVLGFNANSNKTYSILYRDSVEGLSWANLAHIDLSSSNRTVRYNDLVPTNRPTRFYRITTPRLP